MTNRRGKVSFSARLRGIGLKALSRRRRKCPLDPDHKNAANVALATAQSIGEIEQALLDVLEARTSEIPPCRNIRTMIGRKVQKVAKRLRSHTKAT